MLRFGAMNSPFRSVVSEIETIALLGFDFAEVTMDEPQAHHSLLKKEKDRIVSVLRDRDLGLICHLPTFVSSADLTEALRKASVEELVESMETAGLLGAEKIVLHPGHATGLGARVPDLVRKYIFESLDTVLKRAQSLGLTVALENMSPGFVTLTEPEDFDEVLDRYPFLEMTLDMGHAHIGSMGGRRNLAFIKRHGRRIGHVHASDNFGRSDDHLPVGVGSVDFPLLMSALVRAGYDGTITLEVFAPDRDYLKVSREKLEELIKRSV